MKIVEFEYINVKEFLKKRQFLKKGDYLYKHSNNEYPLRSGYDISNLYFVIENNNHALKVQNMANIQTLDVDLTILNYERQIRAIEHMSQKFNMLQNISL